MKKIFIILTTIFALSFLALAEQSVYVYKKDGTTVQYFASTVDSIGFVNAHSITFNANGGTGSMDVICAKDGESITLPANSFLKADAKFVGWNTNMDGSGVSYVDKSTIILTVNITLYAQWNVSTIDIANGHEYVDLGLPSGIYWATKNIGAETPEDYGDYFAWGEIKSKTVYDWDSYKWCNGSSVTQTKYCDHVSSGILDNKIILEFSDDAARVNWGGAWRLPTREELLELRDECILNLTTQKGVKGYLITSKKNGNSIFLPAAGHISSIGGRTLYWSSSLSSSTTSDFAIGTDINYPLILGGFARNMGLPIRPVLGKYK